MGIVDKSAEIQRKIEQKFSRIGKGKYSRILKMSRKPTREEYAKVVTITGLGIIAIGGIGFLIYLLLQVYLKIPK
ncbi:MAG: protein translocase SEC61 complex subunit gamma [Euryarchaeota archaeon]|nr:protein translocase SEC61 complex subunit gamma [Euryarchaeota archaeon]